MKNSIPKNRILLRGAALALALCLLFSCAACGKKNTTTALRADLSGRVYTLDPQYWTTALERCLLKNCMEGLLRRLPDGTIDRPALAAAVFGEPMELKRLVGITFPLILAECEARMDAAEAAGCRACVLDAPTLFESGGDQLCDVIVSVVTPREERLRRVLARDGITHEAAEARMKNQHEDEYYTRRSHFVITNSSDLAHLEIEVERCRRFLCL